jgi:small nuclear ribonucleoprotein (snRNP)-like protein
MIFNADYLNVQPLELVDRSIGKRVIVITEFGYEFQGELMGVDLRVNCVLAEADETRTNVPDFMPKHHSIALVNGSTVSIVFRYGLTPDRTRTTRGRHLINEYRQNRSFFDLSRDWTSKGNRGVP